jgi:hypothetical protein
MAELRIVSSSKQRGSQTRTEISGWVKDPDVEGGGRFLDTSTLSIVPPDVFFVSTFLGRCDGVKQPIALFYFFELW